MLNSHGTGTCSGINLLGGGRLLYTIRDLAGIATQHPPTVSPSSSTLQCTGDRPTRGSPITGLPLARMSHPTRYASGHSGRGNQVPSMMVPADPPGPPRRRRNRCFSMILGQKDRIPGTSDPRSWKASCLRARETPRAPHRHQHPQGTSRQRHRPGDPRTRPRHGTGLTSGSRVMHVTRQRAVIVTSRRYTPEPL